MRLGQVQSVKRKLQQLMLLLFFLSAVPAKACSLASCINHGVELDRSFEVVFIHDKTALKGVSVKVTDAAADVRFSGLTNASGFLLVASLPPGDYWLQADYLRVGAAYQCFHVGARPSRHATRRLSYEWGELAPATSRIAGRLVDSQNGTGGSPIWNITHRVNAPITEARLRLENALTRQIYRTVSDQNGAFAFDEALAGTYVLHIEGGGGPRAYDESDHLIELSPSAKKSTVDLIRREGGGGSCGGTSLELFDESPPASP